MQSKSKINLNSTQISQLSKLALGMKSIEAYELTDGWANTIYRIKLEDGQRCILKISPPQDCRVMRYEKDLIYTETAVLRLLAEHHIPVPEVYAFLEANEVINHPCFFMEFIEGHTLSALRQSAELGLEDNIRIEQKLGGMQAEINNIGQRFDFWGSVTGRGTRFESWHDCFSSMMMDLIHDAEDVSCDLGLPIDQIHSICSIFRQAIDLDSTPALVLWDLHDGNVLIDKNEIRAVIDCDRSFLGDPLMEFWFRELAGDRSELRAAFQKKINRKIFGDNNQNVHTRTTLYNLYLALVMRIECDFRGFSDDHRTWTQKQLMNMLSSTSLYQANST